MLNKEEEVLLGNKISHYIPNKDHKYNFMLDTCAINNIINNDEIANLFINLLKRDYRFYYIDVQTRELTGIIDRKKDFTQINQPYSKKAFDFLSKIQAKRVSCIGIYLHDFFVLDGSMRLLGDTGPITDLVNDVHNNNIHHIKDAVVAEATIYNNCILISDDKRLVKKVNKYFEGKAKLLNDFITNYL